MKKKLTIVNGLLVAAVSLMLFAGCGDDHDTSSTEELAARTVQGEVDGGTLFFDINGNREFDTGEPKDSTPENGKFVLNIPSGQSGHICFTGGTLNGKEVPTMLAPRQAEFITPLTTLAAINPGVKSVLNNWNGDVSDQSVSEELRKLAFSVQSLQSSLKKLGFTPAQQISGLGILASNLEENVELLASSADLTRDPSATSVAYWPSTNLDQMVMPLPNDVVWKGIEGKIPTEDIEDVSKLALYTAINKLNNSGLSPNTPISIPFSDTTELDYATFPANVLVFSIDMTEENPFTMLTPETDFTIEQDNNYLKIYPLGGLESGTKHLVVVKDGLKTTSGDVVAKNPLFELFKSEEKLSMDSLEDIRSSYEPLFQGLQTTIPKSEILTLFTFTTAEKTLSAGDFAALSQVEDRSDLDALNVTGLEYSGDNETIKSEFTNLYSSVPLRVMGSSDHGISPMEIKTDEKGTYFTSFDVTTIASGTFEEERVYFDEGAADYTDNDTLVIFQHGFTSSKDAAAAFASNHPQNPLIAIDLPYHGDRDPTPDTPSGSEFLTTQLPYNRINLYQSFYDLSVLIQGLKAGKFDLNGSGSADHPGNVPSQIHFVGQSLGSITGSVAAKFNSKDLQQNDALDKVVLNVGGANLAALFDTAENALLTSIFDELGLEKNTPEYFVALGIIQLVMDPADPAYLAEGLVDDVPGTIFQLAYNDTIVSNLANKILGVTAGVTTDLQYAYFSNTYSDIQNSDDSFTAGNAYMFGGHGDLDKNWITHGFLLNPSIVDENGDAKYPKAADYLDQSYVNEAYSVVNSWTANYLNPVKYK